MKSFAKTSVLVGAVMAAGHASAAQIVNTLGASVPVSPTAGEWYLTDVRDTATASLVDLTGLGGDLETNQPLPTGALKLTTDFADNDKAEVGTFDDFGAAASLLTSMSVGYSYYKQTVSGGNAFAAPSIKLVISAPGGTGDNYGQLIYEPNWNQPIAGSQPVPTDAWQDVVINATTGAGDDGSGGWWWSGGFEIGSGSGGPPIRSLAEWAAAFTTSDPTDFANARVVGVLVGVGTYNQGQVGYVDQVVLTGTDADETYDFEIVPEPGSIALLGLGGLVMFRRRRGA